MLFTYNCAASGLVFIMVNNFCIWWSCRTLITSGSDRISCILAWSSGDGGTGGCCLALALSVSPMSLSWLTVDFYGNMIHPKSKLEWNLNQLTDLLKQRLTVNYISLMQSRNKNRLDSDLRKCCCQWEQRMMKPSTFSQLSFMYYLEKYVQRTKVGQLLEQWILCSVIPTT